MSGESTARGTARRLLLPAVRAAAFIALLTWLLHGGARSTVARVARSLPPSAPPERDAPARTRLAAPALAQALRVRGRALDRAWSAELRRRSGRPSAVPERRFFSLAQRFEPDAGGGTHAGYAIVPRTPTRLTGEQWIDITFAAELARLAGDEAPLAHDLLLAAVGVLCLQPNMSAIRTLESELADEPTELARRKRAHADYLTGAMLALAGPPPPTAPQLDAALAALRTAESRLPTDRPHPCTAPAHFGAGDLAERTHWLRAGIQGVAPRGAEAALGDR